MDTTVNTWNNADWQTQSSSWRKADSTELFNPVLKTELLLRSYSHPAPATERQYVETWKPLEGLDYSATPKGLEDFFIFPQAGYLTL